MSNFPYKRTTDLVRMAEAAGFPLPDVITTAHLVAERLTAEASRTRPDRVNEARRNLVDAFTRAAGDESPWPDGATVIAADVEAQAEREADAALNRAATNAQGEVVAIVADLGDDIIVNSLRPAVGEVLAAATSAAKALGPYGGAGDLERLLSAPKPARDAWLTLDDLAARYGLLRKARGMLVRTEPSIDDTQLFSEIRNLHELWPTWRQRTGEPWPTDARGRLLWLTRDDVEVWMPTAAEQSARYREVFADGMARVAHARAAGLGGQAPMTA